MHPILPAPVSAVPLDPVPPDPVVMLVHSIPDNDWPVRPVDRWLIILGAAESGLWRLG